MIHAYAKLFGVPVETLDERDLPIVAIAGKLPSTCPYGSLLTRMLTASGGGPRHCTPSNFCTNEGRRIESDVQYLGSAPRCGQDRNS